MTWEWDDTQGMHMQGVCMRRGDNTQGGVGVG